MGYNGNAVQQIGRYRVVGELGRGAMGVVYRAEDPAIGRTVAIKTIRLGDLSDPSEREFMRERLRREARSAGVLSHPGIVTIYDIIEEGDTAYVFMEYVDGETLDKLMGPDKSLGKERMLEILRKTAAALDYAHGKGVVHRDIKPANIMVRVDGETKITDFGVARIVSQQMTQTRAVMGTPSYMSPEQIQGEQVDGKADQFSLAVVAYELLTGVRPYQADSLPTLLFKIVKEMPPPPQRLNATLAPEAETVLTKAFSKDRSERYSTCTEFISALAMAVSKRPEWRPMPRAAGGTTAAAEPLPPPPPVPADAFAPTEVFVQPEDHGAAETYVERAPAAPITRARRDEETGRLKESHLARNVVLATVAVIAFVALGFYSYRNYLHPVGEGPSRSEMQPPVASEPPPAADVPAPSAATPGAEPGTEQQPPAAQERAIPEPSVAVEKPVPEPPKPAVPKAKVERTEAPPPKPVPEEHTIQIRSSPPGATVVADRDSALTCRTPCQLTVTGGRHVLVFTMAGYRLAPRIIRVPEILDVTMNLDRLAGTLAVSSTPPGAAIYLNGELRPEKTPSMIKLSAGTYKIRLVIEGRRPFEDTVEVKDQVITNISVDW